MKSAYELAMERLQENDPDAVVELSDAQREELARLDREYQAQIAEKEVFLNGKLQSARESGDGEAVQQIEKQLQNERERLQDELEAAKDKVRRDSDS